MKAIACYKNLPITDTQALVNVELPKPTPGPRDLLVGVKAIAANPVDYKVRLSAEMDGNTPRILGWDAAGIVESVGSEVTLFQPGDKVYYAGDVTRAGCNAEYQLVDERIVGKMPASLSFSEAAALPLTTITAWETLFDRLRVDLTGNDKNKTVLMVGGAGGVGSIAIQLAKKLAGVTVIATASRKESVDWCRNLGADYVIDHRHDMVTQIKALGFPCVDFIACFNDTDEHFPTLAELIRPQGTITTIVENHKPVDVSLLKTKSALFSWEFMFTRSLFQTPDMIEQHHLLNRVAELVDQGVLRTTVGQHLGVIDAENLKRAHELLEEGRLIGKLVLEGFAA